MGQLNIKDDALILEARALADELGTSVTGALREAVQALRAQRANRAAAEREAMIAAIMAIAANAANASQRLPPGVTSDHSDMYDEHGAPI